MPATNPIEQATRVATVTPNDGADLGQAGAALYVGTGGDVAVHMKGEATAFTFSNVPSGTFMPIQVNRVMVTNTTALNILALYEGD